MPNSTVPIQPFQTILLAKAWRYDEGRRIGAKGSFGEVFEGWASDGSPVAVKRIRRVTPGLATSEIRIAKTLMIRDAEHVIPILDAGNDAYTDAHFIVMPVADGSLQDRLDEVGPMEGDEAMSVFCDVLLGMNEMGDIVHGDLKPANVLFHDNKWKLADLGIARILDEAPTALSKRMFVSAAYASPEQWRFESPSRATDVYAFGCLAYAVITGEPPFRGPTPEEYGAQHLNATPPRLPAPPSLQALVQMCLNKDRASRPSIATALVLIRRARSKK